MRKTVFLLASLFVMVLATQRVNAEDPSTATAEANVFATIIAPISIEKDVDLSFGNIVRGTEAGTVTISTDGTLSFSENFISALTGGTVNAAKFTVTGDESVTYAITLPESIDITRIEGEETMTVTDFTSDPSGTALSLTDGTQDLSVGATLKVGANQAPGQYTGTFSVTAVYN